jgi:hypothetical protein
MSELTTDQLSPLARAQAADETGRLVELLGRATAAVTHALSETRRVDEELSRVLSIGQERPLTPQERTQYVDLARADREALTRFLAARRWRDAVVGRMRDRLLREEDAIDRV